jgi:biofilm PGA synthesis N-glycosyltransferase PgaC
MGRSRRAVGMVVLGGAVLASVVLWAVVSASAVGAVNFDTSPRGPVAFSVALALTLTLAVSLVERRVAASVRRSERRRTPLAPRVVMKETRGVYAGPVTVTVVIPAHNQEGRLSRTLESLSEQSRRPDRVVVVADNCVDDTVGLAQSHGVEVVETFRSSQEKAGALNRALDRLLPKLGDNDLVMVLGAGTVLGPGFLEGAVRRMADDRALMAIGGLFNGDEGGGWLAQFQRNEFTRYARDLRSRRGTVHVLTGTASVFRPRALRAVAAERGRTLPGVPGNVFDTVALTEDNEITLALKSLGALVISPADCTVVTELMPTWRALWIQRLRWQRGALESLGDYGVRMQTWRYWIQQLGISYGSLASGAYLGLVAVTALALEAWVWLPFWLGVGGVLALERVLTVWRDGWRARVLAVALLPELVYASFLGAAHLKGIADITFGRATRPERMAAWTRSSTSAAS